MATVTAPIILDSTGQSILSKLGEIKDAINSEGFYGHNIPRAEPKDITQYVTDGSIYQRLAGTNGYDLYEDLYVGDYIEMSRPISAKNKDTAQQATGSKYVTIAGISCMKRNGDADLNYEHLVMVPGKGFGGDQHFGKSRMNASNSTTGGYVGSELFTDILGAVTSSGSTADGATINQQLYAEFGAHLKTTKEWLSNAINASGYNRFGTNSGCTSANAWTAVQSCLMSEAEVYGATIFGSSGFDSAMNPYQLPQFNFSKLAANNRSAWYWLRDIANSSQFCDCHHIGTAGYNNASISSYFVRPRFVIA